MALFSGYGLNAMWYQAGSWAHMSSCRRIAVRLVSSLRCSARCPLVAGSYVCRKVFILASWGIVVGAAASMRISVMIAQGGRAWVRSRYVFSHIKSIASFLAFMSRRLRPPSSMGHCRNSRVSLGPVVLPQFRLKPVSNLKPVTCHDRADPR